MEEIGYPIFKGLQKPLEFMGIRGKFIYYAAALFLIGFIGFIIGNFIAGFLGAIIVLAVVVLPGLGFIYIKQKLGLHSKKRYKGIVHYTGLYVH